MTAPTSDLSLDDPALTDAAARGDPLALARLLVATPSVNPILEAGGDGEEAVARLGAAFLEEWGFHVELAEPEPGRFNVVARWGQAPGALVLNGHLDTVGVAGMDGAPFGAQVRQGRLWGRGSCDMKGGVAALLAAASRLAREGSADGLVVALTCDEEHGSVGMESLVAGGLGARAAVVCEPTGLAVMPAHKGFLWVEARFRGRAAHGSRPELGVDAILHAGLYLAALEGYAQRLADGPPHPLLGRPSFHAGTIAGGSAPSVYPESCTLVLERRTLPGEDPTQVLHEFREVLRELHDREPAVAAELHPGLFRQGTEVGAEAEVTRGLLAALEASGVPPRVEGMSAWVDAALLNEVGVPAVCFGPGSIALAHSAVEWVEVEEVQRAADVLERFARSFLAG